MAISANDINALIVERKKVEFAMANFYENAYLSYMDKAKEFLQLPQVVVACAAPEATLAEANPSLHAGIHAAIAIIVEASAHITRTIASRDSETVDMQPSLS